MLMLMLLVLMFVLVFDFLLFLLFLLIHVTHLFGLSLVGFKGIGISEKTAGKRGLEVEERGGSSPRT